MSNTTDPHRIFSGDGMSLIKACWPDNTTDPAEKEMACVSSKIIGITAAYLFPIYGAFGSVTNVINFLVFAFWWKKKTRQTIYLSCIAVVDFLMIFLYGWIGLFLTKGLPWATNGRVYFSTFEVSSLSCRFHSFAIAVNSCMATTMMLVAIADRTATMFFPRLFQGIGNMVAYYAIAGVFLFSVLTQLPIVIYVHWFVNNGVTHCWISGTGNDQAVSIFHSMFGDVGVIQSAMIMLISISLFYKVRVTLNAHQRMKDVKGEPEKDKELPPSILILILAAIYIACCLPQVIGYTMGTAIQYSGGHNKLMMNFGWNLGDLGWFIFFLQESLNFVVYMVRVPKFRKIVREKLCCSKLSEEFTPNAYSQDTYGSTGPRS